MELLPRLLVLGGTGACFRSSLAGFELLVPGALQGLSSVLLTLSTVVY